MRHATLILLVLAATGATRATGQSATATLSGRVIDAEGAAPISGAHVVLVPSVALSDVSHAPNRELMERSSARTALTSDGGSYAFDEIPPGAYVLRVESIGYRSAAVEVSFEAPQLPTVSVALRVEPIALAPLSVDTGALLEAPLLLLGIPPRERISLERFRTQRTLAPDARIISMHELGESATLLESDLFRTMHRMAGVSTRDDWSAELWTRGAGWDETRVYLDGIPLFNPVHAFGIFSGFSYQGIGSALFHPGVRAAGTPEGGAAVLELRSRSGVESPRLEKGADLSLGSLHAWARAPLQNGEGGWSVTARRSYVDLLVAALAPRDESFPFVVTDIQSRLDLSTSLGRIEASALWEADRVVGELPDMLHGTTAGWGNLAARTTLHFRPFGLPGRFTVGGTAYRTTIREIVSEADKQYSARHEPPADHTVGYLTARFDVGEVDRGWRGGADVVRQSVAYAGPQVTPWFDDNLGLRDLRLTTEGALSRVGVWGAWRARPFPALDIDVGVRLGMGSAVRGSRIGVQPNGTARVRLSPSATLSLAAGRYLQYTQSPARMGPILHPPLETGRFWVLAGPEQPALDTRVVSLGGEYWPSNGWLASATLYRRSSTGRVLPDPREGFLVDRWEWAVGRVDAWGIDVGARRISGRLTGSVAYSFGRARAEAMGTRFPSPTDRPHTLDGTGAFRISSTKVLQAAYTFAAGSPYTRTSEPCAAYDEWGFCTTRLGLHLDAPFQRRTPAYSSLDLMYASSHRVKGTHLTWYVQLRNALNHDNAVTWLDSHAGCHPSEYTYVTCEGESRDPYDEFIPGMPRAPAVGVRINF